MNLCGSDIGEGKFASLIQAVVQPSLAIDGNEDLKIEFGTTLDTDPYYASYAISALRIYIRWRVNNENINNSVKFLNI